MNNDKRIKDRYKQVKYQHLKKIFEKNLSKKSENCKYNKGIKLPNGYKVNICSFNLEENDVVDICYKPEHSMNCNAFCPKVSKEELTDNFYQEINNDQIRATKYKDINTLFWLKPDLDLSVLKTHRFISKFLSWIKVLFS